MPSKHTYKCLNPRCKPSKSRPITFKAMNSPQPTCPDCGSIKLEDWGEAVNVMSVGGETRRIDSELKSIASHHGMSNMSNKGGKAVKGGQVAAKGSYGSINVGNGVNVAVDHSPTVSRVPMTSKVAVKPLSSQQAHSPANVLAANGG